MMREHHVGSLVVVEGLAPKEQQVVGVLTDRDIATAVVAAQKNPQGVRVADVMSRFVVTAREEDSVLDVLATMRRKGVRRVPIVGPSDRLVGVLAIDDVLELIAEEMQALSLAVGAAQRHELVSST